MWQKRLTVVHVGYTPCNSTAKGAAQSRGGENQCDTERALVGAVPECKVVHQPREETTTGYGQSAFRANDQKDLRFEHAK